VSEVATTPGLEPFVSPEELRLELQADLSDDMAAYLADKASGYVRAEIDQMVNVIEDDEVVLDGSGSGVVLLPQIQVRAVHTVVLAGRLLTEGLDYTWSANGELHRGSPGQHQSIWGSAFGAGQRWPRIARVLTVVYDHGWEPGTPQWEAARTVATEVASRLYRNPEMLQSERIGDYSRAYVPTAGRGDITEVERGTLDILRPGP
jgi:hypothetical protein